MAKKRLGTGYTFTAASKTITHADFSDITLAGIQLIVNVTDQIIIYNFADTTKGGTLATDTLTLEYDTTSMSDTDELMILVEDGVAAQPISASSLPLPTGASTSANQTTIIGHLDGVEGLLTTIDGDTGNISTKIDTLAGAVSGTEMQVDVLSSALPTGASTLAEQQSQTTHLATIAGDTTAIQTAVELLDNAVYVDDADWTADTSSHTLVGAVTQATPSVNTDGDTTPLITNSLRELRLAVNESDLATAATSHVKKYYTNAGAVTDGIIWSPAAGKRWYVTDIYIQVSAASTVTLEDDLAAGDAAIWKAELAANSGWSHSFATPWFSGEDAADLIITTTAGNVYVTVTGYEI